MSKTLEVRPDAPLLAEFWFTCRTCGRAARVFTGIEPCNWKLGQEDMAVVPTTLNMILEELRRKHGQLCQGETEP